MCYTTLKMYAEIEHKVLFIYFQFGSKRPVLWTLLLVCQHSALLPSGGPRQYCMQRLKQWRSKLLQSVGWLTVRVSLSSLSGAVFTNTDVIIPTISGEGTVFSAITCGFSKYLAFWEQIETVVRRNTGRSGKEKMVMKVRQWQVTLCFQ